MLFDALSSVVPTPEAFGAAEATLARMRGYQQHFSPAGGKVPLVGDGSELQRVIEESDEKGRSACPTEEQFDAMLDDAGVSTAVVYTEQYESALGIRTVHNDAVAQYVARNPSRFLGLAGVDPWKDDAVSEINRAVRELGHVSGLFDLRGPGGPGLHPYRYQLVD
jgi:predicted TIM-barrel fold metal-dependent hydrolase